MARPVRKLISLIILFIFTATCFAKETFSVQIRKPRKTKEIKCLLLCIGENKKSEEIAKTLKFDMEFTDQLLVDIKRFPEHLTKKQLGKLYKKGIALCLSCESNNKNKFVIEVKDTHSSNTVFKKAFSLKQEPSVYQAHSISQELLPALTGSAGIPQSSIAYCKQFSTYHKGLFVSDYSCKSERPLFSKKALTVAPRWHSSLPQLFFSQFTSHNGKLMSFDLKSKKARTICSYDGLNMQPSFSPTGDKVVLCLSALKGNSELYLYDQRVCSRLKKRVFIPLTTNGGNNSSPCMLPNNDVVFCSDFQTGMPQLYYLSMATKKIHRLTAGRGYCAGPSYCEKTNSIIYTKPHNKVFQLWSINLDEDEIQEKQLTFGKGDKLDPSWSPCGNYIAFTYDYINKRGKRVPQIATFNISSRKIRILTNDSYPKSFPVWTQAPHYQLS